MLVFCNGIKENKNTSTYYSLVPNLEEFNLISSDIAFICNVYCTVSFWFDRMLITSTKLVFEKLCNNLLDALNRYRNIRLYERISLAQDSFG